MISRWNFGEGLLSLQDAYEEERGFHQRFNLLTAALSELAPVAEVLAIVPQQVIAPLT